MASNDNSVARAIMEHMQRRRLAIRTMVSATTFWLVLGYATWIMNGCRAWLPYISDFDLYEPGDTIFTVGTLASGFLVFWIVMELHSMNMARLTEKGHSNLWHGLNHLAVFPGLVGAFSCIRIGTVPWDTDGPMHGHYAMDIFYNGVYWCLLVTFVSAKIWWSSPSFKRILWLRLGAALSAAIGLYKMITAQIAVWGDDFDWDAYNASASNMLEFCTQALEPAINTGAAWEYVLVAGILGTILSFLPEVTFVEQTKTSESEE